MGQLAQERVAREQGHAEVASGLVAQATAIHKLEEVAQQVQAQQAQLATQQAQAEQERCAWQQCLAEVVEHLRDQQRLTAAISDEMTAVREAQQDWQHQLTAARDGAAAVHADLLAQLQAEQQRRRVLEQRMRSGALRVWRRRRAHPVETLSQADVPTDTQ